MPFTDDDREKLERVHTLVITMLPDHETRIRSNEKHINYMWAWASALGLFASTLWDYFKGKFDA